MPSMRKLLFTLIVAATALFVITVFVERSFEPEEPDEGVEEGSGEEAASDEETLLGFELESPIFVITAVVGSIALAAAILVRPDLRGLLVVTAIVMALFTLLDVLEVVRQVDRERVGVAVLAAFVAILHGAATVVAAGMMARHRR
jgi:hypothetical protein